MGIKETQIFVFYTSIVTFVFSWLWAFFYFTLVTPSVNSPFEKLASFLLIASWTFFVLSLGGLIVYLIIRAREKNIDRETNKDRIKTNTMIVLLLIFSPGVLLFLMYAATFIMITSSILL